MIDTPSLNIKNLSEYFGISVEDLKQKSYAELEQMHNEMARDLFTKQTNEHLADPSFIHIIEKFFTPFACLCGYFGRDAVLKACCTLSERDIIRDQLLDAETSSPTSNEYRDYIKTEYRSMAAYTRNHQRLYENITRNANVYHVKNPYQGIHHGDIILGLLYERYPSLKQFRFRAYEYQSEATYELYPDNNIYVPFTALMNKDIDAIKERNMQYAASYNWGIYTPEQTAARLESVEAKAMFQTILDM